jgi:hypothetical protein
MIDKAQAKQEGILIEDFTIKVSPDDMFLYIEIDPKDTALIENLKKNWEKIKTYLKENKISGVLDDPDFVDNMLIVARGTPPKNPIPERIEIFEKFLPILQRDET